MSLASERIEDQVKEIQMRRKILIKGFPFHSRWDAGCSKCIHTRTHTHSRTHALKAAHMRAHIFQINEIVLFKKTLSDQMHCYGMPVYLPLFWLKSHKNTFNRKT